MKKRFLFLFVIGIILSSNISAQSDTLWFPSGVIGINASQIALDNWTQGGENSISTTLFANLGLLYKKEAISLDNQLKLAVGKTKFGDQELRTNDNELYLESVLSYDMGWALNPYFSNTVRTVILNGYNYKDSTYQISAFFDPGYVTQSIGMMYDKLENFKTRLGLAFQETFTNKFNHYSDDLETSPEIEKFKFETGIESVSEANFAIEENVGFVSKLRLFSAFKTLDTWDIRWDNMLTVAISKYFNVNLNVLVVYEKAQSVKTQFKEALQLGFVYNLF